MNSSKSLFFIRNSQLIRKTAQSSAPNSNLSDIFVNSEGQVSPQKVSDKNGFYYTADGWLHDSQGTKTRRDINVNKMYLQEFGNSVKGANPKLMQINTERQKRGLASYESVESMISEEAVVKRTYEEAKVYYMQNNGMSEADFLSYFPDMYAYELDTKQSGRTIGKKRTNVENYNDEQILDAIKSHNENQLNSIQVKEIMRVLDSYIATLPNINSKRQTLDAYGRNLRLRLNTAQFKNPQTIAHIVSVKMLEAEEVLNQNSSQLAARQERASNSSRNSNSNARLSPNSPGQPTMGSARY